MGKIDREPVLAAFRRPRTRWWLTGCIAIFGLVGLASATVPREAYEEGSVYSYDSGFAISSRVAFGLLAIASLALIVRWIRTGIFATTKAVVVRNVFQTIRVPWEEVSHFERPASYGRLRRTGLPIHRTDGATVYAILYSPGPSIAAPSPTG